MEDTAPLRREIERLASMNKRMWEDGMLRQQTMKERLDYLEEHNRNLCDQLRVTQHRVEEQQFQMERLQRTPDIVPDQTKSMESLSERLKSIHADRSNLQRKVGELELVVDDLRQENLNLRQVLGDSEKTRADQRMRLEELQKTLRDIREEQSMSKCGCNSQGELIRVRRYVERTSDRRNRGTEKSDYEESISAEVLELCRLRCLTSGSRSRNFTGRSRRCRHARCRTDQSSRRWSRPDDG